MKSLVACVTGAAQGIGLAVAGGLADSGWRVLLIDLQDEAKGHQVLRKLKGKGHIYVRSDISTVTGREKILKVIKEKYRQFDLLVNNAGVAPLERKDILETTEESYDRVMSVNLKGTFFLTQQAARYMIELVKKRRVVKPKIINISSLSAYASSIARPEYCLSKAGVSMITILYADRLAEYDINVYEIRPGIIKTPMTETVREKYDRLIEKDGILPISRWGRPEDIAAAVKAIASGSFEYSTGEIFNVDGGFHIRRL
jgi:NAD(P)-dependent dehydrogenase (short-subunit alcohol dehydrogenase family)